jgi:hypothetical protein
MNKSSRDRRVFHRLEKHLLELPERNHVLLFGAEGLCKKDRRSYFDALKKFNPLSMNTLHALALYKYQLKS